MTKRILDVTLSLFALSFCLPLIVCFAFLIFVADGRNPFYFGERVGKQGKRFELIKLRSMIVGADKTGVDSTSASDHRITYWGGIVRRYKIDELPQFLNVLKGDMSIVGPRPNVQRDVAVYTEAEKNLLTVRPGITDPASIVFSDEGVILDGHSDPDLAYHRLVRPLKNRYALAYICNAGVIADIKIIFLTALSLINRQLALEKIMLLLGEFGVDFEYSKWARRDQELIPMAPVGSEGSGFVFPVSSRYFLLF